MNEWVDLLLALGFWTVLTWAAGVPACYFFWKMDRKVKDGYRCRSCGYDLRVSTTAACAECGSNFHPKGIWPPGKPNRKQLVIYIFIWSWLSSSFTLLGANLYTRYVQDSIREVWVSEDAVLLVEPESEAYQGVIIEIAGREWQWVSAGNESLVKPTQASILLYDGSSNLVAATSFNIESLELEEPINSAIEIDIKDVNGSVFGGGQTAENVLLSGLDNNVGTYDRNAVIGEIQAMTRFIRLLCHEIKLSNQYYLPKSRYEVAITESEIDQHFQRTIQGDTGIEDYVSLTPWAILIPVLTGFIAWIVVCLILRKIIYARMAVGAISE